MMSLVSSSETLLSKSLKKKRQGEGNHLSILLYLCFIVFYLNLKWASLVVQTVRNPPAIRETWVRSLGWEDPLEEGRATHSSILA